MNSYKKMGAPLGRAKVYFLRRNVYQQDELSPPNKVELLRVNKVGETPSWFWTGKACSLSHLE
jgi:hypothetical protein